MANLWSGRFEKPMDELVDDAFKRLKGVNREMQ